MKMPLNRIDWSLIQAFLAVAETGSLSAAAREMGASQPTLGRQIKALEAELDADLFSRQPRGLVLTDTGAALLEPANAMRTAMGQITLTAAGQSAQLEGTVRITASVMTALYHLPPIIADIRKAEPQIAIDLVPSDSTSNLLYREADIAVRMYRPTQLDLITRHIGDLQLGVFAAKSYLRDNPGPLTPQDVSKHQFVGYDAQTDIIDGFRSAGITVNREFFKTRCDDNVGYWNLVRAGCGIGFGQVIVGRQDPLVEEIDIGLPIPPLPMWLTAHEAMRQTPRIRRVWDSLSDRLETLAQESRSLTS